MKQTILDKAIQESINTNFLQEWQPFDVLNKQVERAIFRHFYKGTYQFQPTHDAASKKPFKPYSFAQVDSILGLAYTSTGAYAGLWCCNGGYLWADSTHYFIGFAINTDGKVIGIAHDEKENEFFVTIS